MRSVIPNYNSKLILERKWIKGLNESCGIRVSNHEHSVLGSSEVTQGAMFRRNHFSGLCVVYEDATIEAQRFANQTRRRSGVSINLNQQIAQQKMRRS